MKWRDALSNADDDLARDLMALGREHGWVRGRRIVPPGTEPPSPNDVMNDAIRRAAGR